MKHRSEEIDISRPRFLLSSTRGGPSCFGNQHRGNGAAPSCPPLLLRTFQLLLSPLPTAYSTPNIAPTSFPVVPFIHDQDSFRGSRWQRQAHGTTIPAQVCPSGMTTSGSVPAGKLSACAGYSAARIYPDRTFHFVARSPFLVCLENDSHGRLRVEEKAPKGGGRPRSIDLFVLSRRVHQLRVPCLNWIRDAP